MMSNLSQQRRQRMLEFLDKIRSEHNDDESLIAIHEIEAELTSKKYGLVWEEHEERVDVQMQNKIPVFTEVTDKEIVNDCHLPYHFLLEGDNLHSLRLMEKTHRGKIDVIYIDPPYNTGNHDFMYDDSFVDSNDGYRHSKWLSFMSVRLRIAKNLLSETGVIFISINHYEFGPLKVLCDEIFDEINFVGHLTWESTTQPINAGTAKFQLQQKVESIYCYAKNKKRKNAFLLKKLESNFQYPHQGKFGKCRFEIIEKSDSGQYRRDTMKFAILGQYPRKGKRWQIGESTARQLEAAGKVEIVDGIVKRAVYPEDEIDKLKYAPFWSHLPSELVGTAQNGKEELNTIMERPVGFDTVKPMALIEELLSHFEKDITVLDFFAGSGTTAHAVLKMNAEDKGRRKFILCTNNENHICEEITYERIKRAIQGYGQVQGLSGNLKYYKTDFIAKNLDSIDNSVSSALVNHCQEMVQLEHAVKLDGAEYKLVFSDEEADAFLANTAMLDRCKALYVSPDVLFTAKQQKEISARQIAVFVIPDYYFESELLEVGER